MIRNQKGFTLIELKIVIAFFAIIACIISLLMSDIYFTQSGILQEVQVDYPEIEKILKSDRGLFESTIMFETTTGNRVKLCLDSNILFNYDLHMCE